MGRLDADDALETAAAWERLVAHAQAQQFRALARFASLRQAPDLDEFAADEVAPVLHLSRGTAGARLDLATRLSTQLPDTLAELQAGTIDLPKARAISEATEVLDKPATAAVRSRVLPAATTQTVGELRAALSRPFWPPTPMPLTAATAPPATTAESSSTPPRRHGCDVGAAARRRRHRRLRQAGRSRP
ncbi:MAG TPA: DUF222 domain-containing protein [Pseudonocardiaceae bacterium]